MTRESFNDCVSACALRIVPKRAVRKRVHSRRKHASGSHVRHLTHQRGEQLPSRHGYCVYCQEWTGPNVCALDTEKSHDPDWQARKS